MLTFQKGTKLILTDGVDRYEFLVSSATANQTFKEVTINKKTIHNRLQVEDSLVTEKINSSFDFSVYLTPAHGVALMKWFGLTNSSGNIMDLAISSSSELSKSWDLYIDSGNSIYKINSVVGEVCSFSINRKQILSASITGTGVNLTEVASIPAIGSLFTQSSIDFYNSTIEIPGYTRIAGVTCEFVRNITWLQDKNLHAVLSGQVYTATTPVLTSYSISGSITQNKEDNTNTFNASTEVFIQYGTGFEIKLTVCNTTDRWQLGSIHQKITDYKMLPTATNSYIKF